MVLGDCDDMFGGCHASCTIKGAGVNDRKKNPLFLEKQRNFFPVVFQKTAYFFCRSHLHHRSHVYRKERMTKRKLSGNYVLDLFKNL